MEENIENIQSRVQSFTEMMREQVKNILDGDNKNPINNEEIQIRMDSFLHQKLADDNFSTDLPPYAEILSPDKEPEIMTVGDACKETASDIQHDLITGENYDTYFNNSLLELVQADILKPSEISEKNAQTIVKAYMVMQIKLNKILAARYEGDYALENLLALKLVDNHICVNESRPNLMLSELIEKYIATNLSDGRWQKHTLSDHKNRVNSLLLIAGDKSVNTITRDEIRIFSETIKKLPPRWKNKLDKSGKTIN